MVHGLLVAHLDGTRVTADSPEPRTIVCWVPPEKFVLYAESRSSHGLFTASWKN